MTNEEHARNGVLQEVIDALEAAGNLHCDGGLQPDGLGRAAEMVRKMLKPTNGFASEWPEEETSDVPDKEWTP